MNNEQKQTVTDLGENFKPRRKSQKQSIQENLFHDIIEHIIHMQFSEDAGVSEEVRVIIMDIIHLASTDYAMDKEELNKYAVRTELEEFDEFLDTQKIKMIIELKEKYAIENERYS